MLAKLMAEEWRTEQDQSSVRAVPVEVGLKVSVRDCVLNDLKDNSYIQQNFKLNIKRINRWWYSVYFDKICKHDAETLIFGDDVFCSECRLKLQ